MNPKPTGWDELHLAENPAVALLESLSYTCIALERDCGDGRKSHTGGDAWKADAVKRFLASGAADLVDLAKVRSGP